MSKRQTIVNGLEYLGYVHIPCASSKYDAYKLGGRCYLVGKSAGLRLCQSGETCASGSISMTGSKIYNRFLELGTR